MDVRCEKCRTEYELDESKLKPGGVTVKCTSCGHMFKVRRRITAIGPAVVGPKTLRNLQPEAPESAPVKAPEAQPAPDEKSLAADEALTWLVRVEDGEILTCRELATLQKWIVAGRVNRVCQISRSGKKWKPLGEIGELSSFFEIADEARAAAGKAPVVPTRTLLGHPNVVPRAPTAPSAPAAPVIEPPAQPKPAPSVSPPPPAQSPSGPKPAIREQPPSQANRPPAKPSVRDDRETGEWASGGTVNRIRGGGPSGPGPSRGLPRASSHAEVEFAGLSARIGDRRGEFENGAFVPTDDIDEIRGAGGSGRLIAIFSILVILGGLAILYFVVFRDKEEVAENPVAVDASAVATISVDAAGEAPIDPGDVDAVLSLARDEVGGDTVAGLEVALDKLKGLPESAADELPVMSSKARVQTALALHKLDEAELIERPSAKKLAVTDARKLAASAEEIGKAIFAKDSSNIAGLVVLADAIRIRNQKSNQPGRYLRKALKIDPTNVDARLSRALLHLHEDNARLAKKTLATLVKESPAGDVRAAYRLARIAAAEKDFKTAKTNLDIVLSAQAEHVGAGVLARSVTEALAAEPDDGGSGDGDGDPDDPSVSVDSYDRLLAKADAAAETGNCGSAIPLYQRALDAKPSGVAALTGLGFCYLDGGRLSSAHTKFRAALGISSRYQDAMWGMAELYERQGNKAQAVSRYQKFIDAHPGSSRSVTARRKIEQLGGAPGGDGDGSGSAAGSGDGSGSASGGAGAGAGAGSGSAEQGGKPQDKAPDSGQTHR